MNIHIINTGRELMLGRVLNTHQQWLCQQLSNQGYYVRRQVSVDDSAASIHQAVRESLAEADLVITTGGLGPTNDDRTRDLIAELLGLSLSRDPAVVAHIESFFAARHKPCPNRVLVQARIPAGATVLLNENGTAPGLVMETTLPDDPARSSLLIMLPGPPRELRPMFTRQALPIILKKFPRQTPFAFRVLRSTGLGESLVEEKLHDALLPLTAQGLETGYCARPGEVDVQLLVRGPQAPEVLDQAVQIVRHHIGHSLFGVDDEQLEEVVVAQLTRMGKTLALAESCTGGYLANRLTNVPGASRVFLAGLVTYSNQAKQAFLDVPAAILDEHGAVSKPTALAMAAGARQRTGADYALALTGIAGPTGGSDDKPVGTVFVALAGPGFCKAHRFANPFNRETFKYVSSQQALAWLRQTLLNVEGASG